MNADSLKPDHIEVDIHCEPLQDPPQKNNIFTLPLHTELDNEHIVKIFSKVSVGFAHLGGGGGAARKKFKYSQILKQRCSAPRISLTTNTFSFRRNMSAPGPGRGSGCPTSKCSASALVPLNTVFGTLCPATCQMTSRSALQMWEGSRAGKEPSAKFSHSRRKPLLAPKSFHIFTWVNACLAVLVASRGLLRDCENLAQGSLRALEGRGHFCCGTWEGKYCLGQIIEICGNKAEESR